MARIAIIGSNRGIGLELCRQHIERGDDVVAVCRKSNDELRASGAEVQEGVDITNQESLTKLAAKLGPASIDQLLVVAGILERVALTPLDVEAVRRQFEVNALGPLQAVANLLSCLKEGSKVGLLTSRMGSIEDNTSGGSYGYRMSKAALNMAGKSLAHDLHGQGIAVALLHPGYVRTEMTRGSGNIDASDSAAGLVARMDELTLQTSGGFWHQDGQMLPW